MRLLGLLAALLGLYSSLIGVVHCWQYSPDSSVENILTTACDGVDLLAARELAIAAKNSAAILHIRSALSFILDGDITRAISEHLEAKAVDPAKKVIPPLAKLNLDKHSCGGLSDIYYVTAVIIKSLVDSYDSQVLYDGHTTLVQLAAASGLYDVAKRHLLAAKALNISSDASLDFRSALLLPAVYTNMTQLLAARQWVMDGLDSLAQRGEQLRLTALNEFTMTPTFYYIYQGFNDRELLESLHGSYRRAYPALQSFDYELYQRQFHPERAVLQAFDSHHHSHEHHDHHDDHHDHGEPGDHSHHSSSHPSLSQPSSRRAKLKIGFVSSHFRRHSICKLFCNIILSLAESSQYDISVFSALSAERNDDYTRRLLHSPSAGLEYIEIGKYLVSNRIEVLRRDIDVLVYLDIGMEPSVMVWAGSRLAPIQICTWGHPSTSGLPSMDYYLSSDVFHQRWKSNESSHSTGELSLPWEAEESYFSEQLIRLESISSNFITPERLDKSITSHMAINRTRRYFLKLLDVLGASKGTAGVGRLRELIQAKLRDIDPSSAASSATGSLPPLLSGRYQYLLCPQYLTKLHPQFDEILLRLVTELPNAVIVFLANEKAHGYWRKTVLDRWRAALQSSPFHLNGTSLEEVSRRLYWLDSLNPREYLVLQGIGDVFLDPFPFGGGVTVYESFIGCTPVVTAPSLQTVPALAQGLIKSLNLDPSLERHLIVDGPHRQGIVEDYIASVKAIVGNDSLSLQLRREICTRYDESFVQSQLTAAKSEWTVLLDTLHAQLNEH